MAASADSLDRQLSTLPTPQPYYILRGHVSQIHAVKFIRCNSRLLTGDAHGWVVFWKLETKRALAVWRAHTEPILAIEEWGNDKIITHGRDNTLRIWQLRPSDESALSTILPTEDATTERPKPWLLHTLPVNTLNFCGFSMCREKNASLQQDGEDQKHAILVAVPARDDRKIELYQFPDEKLKCIVPRVQSVDTGMVMAVKIAHHNPSNTILIMVGYEGGHVAMFQADQTHDSTMQSAELVYLSQPHTQPVLSIDSCPDVETCYSSSADAIIAAHRVPALSPPDRLKAAVSAPKHDEDISKDIHSTELSGSVQDINTTQPPTAPIQDPTHTSNEETEIPLSFSKKPIPQPTTKPTGLSSLLSRTPHTKTLPPAPPPNPKPQPAHKTVSTKHAGQQSLRVRSDARILATAGWDSRVRIYSAKTLREVAVLKWHKEGVYAVDLARVVSVEEVRGEMEGLEREIGRKEGEGGEGGEGEGVVGKRETGLARVQRKREEGMQVRHWVVAGAKDGKVSLWEVF